MGCDHTLTEIRLRTHDGGSKHYGKQCLRCGRKRGNSFAATFVVDGLPLYQREIPLWDEELDASFLWAEQREQEINQQRDRVGLEAFDYHTYLQSDQWKGIRTYILNRDGDECQGCLLTQARDVHHKTYAHVGQEFMFELISVCRDCHDRIHEKGIWTNGF